MGHSHYDISRIPPRKSSRPRNLSKGSQGEKKGEFHAGFVYFNSFHYCLVRSGQLILWLTSKNRF